MSGHKIVILGLSITSSWGNGHATTYRGLVRELGRRGNDILFLERDVPWYANNRDLPAPPGGQTVLYAGLRQLQENFADDIRDADMVIVGSYLPQGIDVARWVLDTARGVTAFYDIDTPITLARLACGDAEYLSAELIPDFDLYLSFTGGPTLQRLEQEFGARRARPLYCSVDPAALFSAARRRSLGLRLSRHLQPRPPAAAGSAAARPGPGVAGGAFRRCRRAVPHRHPVAGQCRAHRPSAPLAAPRLLQRPAVHPEHHPGRHDPRRLVAERTPVRGGLLRGTDHQRLVARAGPFLRTRPRHSHRPDAGRGPSFPARDARSGATGHRPQRPPAHPARTYRRPSGRTARRVPRRVPGKSCPPSHPYPRSDCMPSGHPQMIGPKRPRSPQRFGPRQKGFW